MMGALLLQVLQKMTIHVPVHLHDMDPALRSQLLHPLLEMDRHMDCHFL